MNSPSRHPYTSTRQQRQSGKNLFSYPASAKPNILQEDQSDKPNGGFKKQKFWYHCMTQTAWLGSALCLMLLIFMQSVHATGTSEHLTDVAGKVKTTIQQEPEPGTGMLYSKKANYFESIPLLQTSASLDIAGIASKVIFRQSFSNTSEQTIEGLYLFPLPENAAIRNLQINIGKRTIHGMIRERKSAENLYRHARDNGRVAGIVKQRRPNLFSLDIANIAPGERIDVELEYIQTVAVDNNRYSLRIPLTHTPRYSNKLVPDSAEISTIHTTRAKQYSHGFELYAHIRSTDEFSVLGSESHALHYTHDSNGYQITLAQPAKLDRDIEIHWRPAAATSPAVSIFSENVGGENFILGLLKPPLPDSSDPDVNGKHSPATSLARELVMIIDTSGSMAGEPLDTATRALQDALQGLNENDFFNVISFSDQTKQLFATSRIATPDNLENAHTFIRDLNAEGGTEMMPALRAAFRNQNPDLSALVKQIVFITDGAVGYESSVFAEIAKRIGDSRLFTVGIGQAPNGHFMKRAAINGRGTYTFIATPAQVSQTMRELFRKLESPVLKDIEVQWLGQAGELAVPKLRDLHAGEPLVFSAKLGESTRGVKLSGLWGRERWEQQVLFGLSGTAGNVQAENTPASQGVSTLWAREKIEALMRKMNESGDFTTYQMSDRDRLNADGDSLPINNHNNREDFLRKQIVELALAHKLVTPFTSLVAIDEIVTRAVKEPLNKVNVPNLFPAGQLTKINLPQGATGIDGLWLISASSFVLALLLGFLLLRVEYLSFGEIA